MTFTPEQWRELEAVGLPPLPDPPAPPGPRALNDVLATRSHVELLRVLTLDRSYSFTARGLARTAETSRIRALDVVRHLGSIGTLIGHHTHIHSIYRSPTPIPHAGPDPPLSRLRPSSPHGGSRPRRSGARRSLSPAGG